MTGLITAGTYGAAVIALAGAAGLVARLFKKAVEESISSKLDALQRQLNEADEDLVRHNAAVTLQLSRLEECLAEVRMQVFPNSGSSLRDRVDELYELVASS